MRKHIFFTGMFSLALAFMLTAAGCDMLNGTTEPTRYTVTYYLYEGAEPTSETVESGLSASLFMPFRDGYTFDGWYTSPNGGGTRFTLGIPITADITLYAKWVEAPPSQFTVTFNANGGTVTRESVTVEAGGIAGELPIPTKTGVYFWGWYTKDGTDNDWGNPFKDDTAVSANMTVYARWGNTSDPATYRVDFNLMNNEIPSPDPTYKNVIADDPLGTLPTVTPSSQYTFDGWYTNPYGYGDPVTETFVVTTKTTIFGNWKATVTFNPDGGTVNPPSIAVPIAIPAGGYFPSGSSLPTPTKPGYTFGGWYTAQNGSGTRFTKSTLVMVNITVYAKWMEAGDGSGGIITFTGIDPQHNGKYATFRSSANSTSEIGGKLVGTTSSTTITGVQINDGSVVIPVYLAESDDSSSFVPYAENGTDIKIYLIIQDTPEFTNAVLTNDGQHTIRGVNFNNGNATVDVNGLGVATKWQGTYVNDEYSVTLSSNSVESDGHTLDNISTDTGGNVLYSGSTDIGDWAYILYNGSPIGFVMEITEGEPTEGIALGAQGVTELMAYLAAHAPGVGFSSGPSSEGMPTDDYVWVLQGPSEN